MSHIVVARPATQASDRCEAPGCWCASVRLFSCKACSLARRITRAKTCPRGFLFWGGGIVVGVWEHPRPTSRSLSGVSPWSFSQTTCTLLLEPPLARQPPLTRGNGGLIYPPRPDDPRRCAGCIDCQSSVPNVTTHLAIFHGSGAKLHTRPSRHRSWPWAAQTTAMVRGVSPPPVQACVFGK